MPKRASERAETKKPAALYRKYRSQNFDELVGQPHVTTSLSNAIKTGKISHAYLFSGTRGTGKTSAARIFAYQVNKLEPATNHLDIIEIDAASNRGIDEIRDLREKVHSVPAAAEYKVYIIDEAHMLTSDAFNALLKTLEEPPAHAIFILVTTEPHKLPATIISRTQRFNFRPLPEAIVIKQLEQIAKKEGIKYDPAALGLIALAGEGSLRDSISLLDQLATMAGDKPLSASQISQHLGMAQEKDIKNVIENLNTGNVKALIKAIDELTARGINVQQFGQQVALHLRHDLRAALSTSNTNNASAQGLAGLLKVLTTPTVLNAKSWAALEALLIDLALKNHQVTAPKNDIEPLKEPLKTPQNRPVSEKKVEVKKPTEKPTAKLSTKSLSSSDWDKILTHVKTHHNSLYALLKAADPKFNPGTIILTFRFQFHKRRLEEAKSRELLTQAVIAVHGQPLLIETAWDNTRKAAPVPQDDSTAVDSVLEMLGGEIITDNS